MTAHIVTIAAIAGLGTFLLRWFPIVQHHKVDRLRAKYPALDTYISHLGPAAVVAFLVLTMLPYARSANATEALAALLAVLSIQLTRRVARGIVIPTLAAAAVYGVAVTYLPL